MDQELQYVLHSYQSGKLDTKNALISVRKRVEIQNHTVLRRWVAIAATLLALVVGGSWVYLTRRITTLSADAVAQTYRLQDGTKVILSPHSSLSYRGWNNRKVEITGKVYLDIRHDATHPFEIQDCTYTIHDIGTCLQVEENGSATTVYVLHGAAYFASTRQPRNGVVLKEKMGAILSDGCDVPNKPSTEWLTVHRGQRMNFILTILPCLKSSVTSRLIIISDFSHLQPHNGLLEILRLIT